jgi:hypothetical protein
MALEYEQYKAAQNCGNLTLSVTTPLKPSGNSLAEAPGKGRSPPTHADTPPGAQNSLRPASNGAPTSPAKTISSSFDP